MANVGLILLIVFAALMTITILSLLIWASIDAINERNQEGKTPETMKPCSDYYEQSTLISIPLDHPRCIQNGVETELFYIGNISGNNSYDFVVAPRASQPLDVCVGYCSEYNKTTNTCIGDSYNGVSAQIKFDQCMDQLGSTECLPPKPIASRYNPNDYSTIYYAYSPTCNICDNCTS